MNIQDGTIPFEVLVSTMYRTSLGFLDTMFCNNDLDACAVLIINQTESDKILRSDRANVRIVNSFERGLSKSRNLALEHALGEICLISDDDVVFYKDFQETILNAYKTHIKADIIRFKIDQPGRKRSKKYPKETIGNMSVLQILSSSSVELSVKKPSIKKLGIRFDEHFGLGATFAMGEENIFLHQLKRAGAKLVFEPKPILTHPGESSDQKTNLKMRYMAQGALFYKLFDLGVLFWIPFKMLFDIKQGRLPISRIFNVMSYARQGVHQLKKLAQ